MENEIKVGEWIRTNWGHIGKLKRIELDKNDKSLKWYVFDHKEFEINIIKEEYINKPYIVKHSPNPIDIIEDNDFCKIEFYSPRYKKRGTRIFEVSKIDEYITFENMHCDLFMKNGEWGNHDKELKPVIKEIYTKEMMESISYKVTKM